MKFLCCSIAHSVNCLDWLTFCLRLIVAAKGHKRDVLKDMNNSGFIGRETIAKIFGKIVVKENLNINLYPGEVE